MTARNSISSLYTLLRVKDIYMDVVAMLFLSSLLKLSQLTILFVQLAYGYCMWLAASPISLRPIDRFGESGYRPRDLR